VVSDEPALLLVHAQAGGDGEQADVVGDGLGGGFVAGVVRRAGARRPAADMPPPGNQSSRCISAATCCISSRLGVIRPDRPMMSAPSTLALARMSWHGTIRGLRMCGNRLRLSSQVNPHSLDPMRAIQPTGTQIF
jgi:hypothetical protein